MKFISWNVNGIRAICDKKALDWLKNEECDFIGFQEVKASEDKFPKDIYELGFEYIDYNCAKRAGYSGVMSLAKFKSEVFKCEFAVDDEGRVLEHRFDNIALFNIYFPGISEDSIAFLPMEISGRDLVLFFGGLFLIIKPIMEIVEQLKQSRGEEHHGSNVKAKFWTVIVQIILLDIVFSLDSVITAVGIAQDIEIMVLAVIVAVAVMLFASKPIADFVETYPSIKILALSFLIMVGLVLVCESLDIHISKAYIYTAMIFSLSVEILNIFANKHQEKQD